MKYKRVYAVIVDPTNKRCALNLKDCLLMDEFQKYEGKIALFGGEKNQNETELAALKRELKEEISGIVSDKAISNAQKIFDSTNFSVFLIQTNLGKKTINLIKKNCREGDGVVRSFAWIKNQPPATFLTPVLKRLLISIFDRKK